MHTPPAAPPPSQQLQEPATVESDIRCKANGGRVDLIRADREFPVRLVARTEDGRRVVLNLSPIDADRLGRQLISRAVDSLAHWPPRPDQKTFTPVK